MIGQLSQRIKVKMTDPFSDHKEPEEIFLPLDSRQYAELYSIEMENFVEDIKFYQDHCKSHSHILELGCGTGRISRALSPSAHSVTGLDISLSMLQQASIHLAKPPYYICADMTKMAFNIQFDHILIPYNTLNLLASLSTINRCLKQVNSCLKRGGALLFQVHIPSQQLIELKGNKLFQFQIFSLPKQTPGKLIKETLRSYHACRQEIRLEERYRIRPERDKNGHKNLSHVRRLAAFPLHQWLDLLRAGGFNNISLYGDYHSRPFKQEHDSMLLIKAQFS